VLSNILGLQVPLTPVLPETPAGIIIDILMSLWTMLLATTAMGIAAGMCLIQNMSAAVPDSIFGFFRYLLLYIPSGLLLLACFTGGLMALVEDWTFMQGLIFMAGAIADLANPIVNVAPDTAEGAFVESLCMCIELVLGGAVIGVIGGHPIVGRFIDLFEGETVTVKDLTDATDVKDLTDATDVTDVPDFDDSVDHASLPARQATFGTVTFDTPTFGTVSFDTPSRMVVIGCTNIRPCIFPLCMVFWGAPVMVCREGPIR